MSQADTKFELEQAQIALVAAQGDWEAIRQERNALLIRARKEGVRPGELVKITGLTSARIAQLRKRRKV